MALDGRPVTLEGMTSAGNRITRQVMACCAADARPVSLPVEGELPPVGSWIRVSGELRADDADLRLRARTVTGIHAPDRPFL